MSMADAAGSARAACSPCSLAIRCSSATGGMQPARNTPCRAEPRRAAPAGSSTPSGVFVSIVPCKSSKDHASRHEGTGRVLNLSTRHTTCLMRAVIGIGRVQRQSQTLLRCVDHACLLGHGNRVATQLPACRSTSVRLVPTGRSVFTMLHAHACSHFTSRRSAAATARHMLASRGLHPTAYAVHAVRAQHAVR
jgi:hypothetical protein